MKKIISLLAVFILMTVLPVTAMALPGDLGEPFSSFNRGSAGILKDKTVIVSFFVDTPSSTWDMKSMKKENSVLESSLKYIKKQASKYDVECEFVYDWTESKEAYRDLYHRGRIKTEPEDTNVFYYYLDDMIAAWKESTTSYEDLALKYDAANVFMIVFFNCKGRDYAITFDGFDSPKESLVSFSKSGPCALAHEILHLFGAHDYYEEAEYDRDQTDYLKKKYKNDIMLNIDRSGGITKTVGKLTAYHLGWIDYAEDIEEYPGFER